MLTFISVLFSIFIGANFNATATADNTIPVAIQESAVNTPPLYVWRWDGQKTQLSSKGKKKLADLRKKIKNNQELKKLMTNLDFEYNCSKVTAFADPCKNGRAGDTKSYWKEGKDVCNLPNYCPNVPGL